MSVIPAEQNLVMSFPEAARAFQHDSFRRDSGASGTPRNSRPTTPSRYETNGSYGHTQIAPPLHPYGTYNKSPPMPFGTGEGDEAGVVPPAQPTPSQIDAHPGANVDIRDARPPTHIIEEDEYYRNPWFKVRGTMRQYFAEFLGTVVLVLWGEGTQAQVVAARKEPGDYLSIAWGWGVGFLLAIYLSAGISGGHINPAVTISLAVFRGFSWRKVPGYICAQLLGGFVGAAIVYGVYFDPLHSLGGYASVLTTGSAALVPTLVATFFSVFTGAALLMLSIATFTDTGNNPATPGMTPLLLGLVMVGIASAFGYQTGFVLNPARDLGPRLLVWATGGGGSPTRDLWLANWAYGIWIPTVGTITGALFGIFMYDLLIYNGRDSPINYNFSRRGRKLHRQALTEKADLEGGHRLSGSTYIDSRTSDPKQL